MSLSYFSVTIPINTALSNAVDLGGFTPVGIYFPLAWTAAALGIAVSRDNGQFSTIYTAAGADYGIATPVAGGLVPFLPSDLLVADRWIKLRSGTAASPVNQAAARTLVIVARQL